MQTYFVFRQEVHTNRRIPKAGIKEMVLDVQEARVDDFEVSYSNILFLQDGHLVLTASAPSEEALRASQESKGLPPLGPNDVHRVVHTLRDIAPIQSWVAGHDV